MKEPVSTMIVVVMLSGIDEEVLARASAERRGPYGEPFPLSPSVMGCPLAFLLCMFSVFQGGCSVRSYRWKR